MFSLQQYRAAREGAVAIDRSSRGLIGVTGRDRAAYLQGLLTNDILAVRPGSGCYAAYLTPQGRMIADMRVLELGEMLLLDLRGDVAGTVRERLEQFIFSEEVQVRDLGPQWVAIGVHGPSAASAVAGVLSADAAPADADLWRRQLDAFDEFQNARMTVWQSGVVVAGSRDLGLRGFDVYLPPDRRADLLARLSSAGVPPAGVEVAEVLRVEAGRPEFRADMDETTIPLEAGIEDRAISFTKGCYVGQEVIVRVTHRGHGRVARRLVGILGPAWPPEESSGFVRGAPVAAGGKDIGRLTTVVGSPALERHIALGFVHRDYAEPGTAVVVRTDRAPIAAEVASLPFVPFQWGPPSGPGRQA